MKRISRLIQNAHDRQSKLSQEQLLELQKSTHFDKKELQQWYKGAHTCPNPSTRGPIPQIGAPLPGA